MAVLSGCRGRASTLAVRAMADRSPGPLSWPEIRRAYAPACHRVRNAAHGDARGGDVLLNGTKRLLT